MGTNTVEKKYLFNLVMLFSRPNVGRTVHGETLTQHLDIMYFLIVSQLQLVEQVLLKPGQLFSLAQGKCELFYSYNFLASEYKGG